MEIKTVEWKEGAVAIIDQTLLPRKYLIRKLTSREEVWEAIKKLRVRGAPAIGIAAAMGLAAEMAKSGAQKFDAFYRELEEVSDYLATSRPTAVNLFWALERMKKSARANRDKPIEELKEILIKEAIAILEEDRAMCRAIGEAGVSLIKEGASILTHCNAGGLATSGFGTALAPIYVAREKVKKIKVFADETRPLLQGARLTVWELTRMGVDVTLICDNMAALVMKEGKIDLVITGADRVAANGDAANKIGTYGVAILAKAHGIPFYMAWPASTLDLSLSSGKEIPIEERGKEELINFGGSPVAPENAHAYCPAFDVTPHQLITAFITDRGLIYPPFEEKLKEFTSATPA